MYTECHSNEGFEDQLTENTKYAVKEIGTNSFLIENDKGESCWYGTPQLTWATSH
jgi:hypothetical protein